MIIHDFTSARHDGRVRMGATVTWEDCDRRPVAVYGETEEALAPAMACNPQAFVVAAALPAMRHGERRIRLDAEISPDLAAGLTTAMTVIAHWYGGRRTVVPIEAPRLTRTPPPTRDRAAFFCSGGIDALATLLINRANYPIGHPGAIRDGLVVCGLEVEQREAFHLVVDSLRPLAESAGIDLVPVYTNVRLLDDGWDFWSHEFASAVLAFVAHALRSRVTAVSISASDDIPHLEPYGSHPLLDPLYSSHDMRIRHEGICLSRLEKTRLVAGWDRALQSLRVCNKSQSYRPGGLNCGRCEKCVRTMLALMALGALDRASAFVNRELSSADIRSAVYVTSNTIYEYEEIIPLLAQRGRDDLVRAIKDVIDRGRGETGLRGAVRRLDRLHLNGSISTLKRSLSRREASA